MEIPLLMDVQLSDLEDSKLSSPRFPDIEVELTGQDGNVFNLIGLVSRELPREHVKEFRIDIMSSKSYEDALVKMSEWVVIS